MSTGGFEQVEWSPCIIFAFGQLFVVSSYSFLSPLATVSTIVKKMRGLGMYPVSPPSLSPTNSIRTTRNRDNKDIKEAIQRLKDS